MLKDEMLELLSVNSTPCVSITIPFIRKSSEREQDKTKLKNALFKAEKELSKLNGKGSARKLIDRLANIPSQIDLLHAPVGVGIYLSEETNKIVNFPFQVREKVVVGDDFEIRDFVYCSSEIPEYLLLLISKKGASLFKGFGGRLTEIGDGTFPLVYTEIFEYTRPHVKQPPGFSARGVTIDKSVTEDKRRMAHMKKIDNALHSYISGKTKLVIAGVEQNLSFFKETSSHTKNIIFSITGNFDLYNETGLSKRLKPELDIYAAREKDILLQKLDKLTGIGRVASGINDVWKNAFQGKGETLIVEKDYVISGWTTEDKSTFMPEHDGSAGLKKAVDAVDDVIQAVINFRGNVVFVDNDRLPDSRRIALILRYGAAKVGW